MGSSLSIFDCASFGSSISVRRFGRFGSSMAIHGMPRFGASLSLLDAVQFGSSISLRRYARLGSTFAILAIARFGSSLSIFDEVRVGSSVSLRSFARLGSSFSIACVTRLGASDSLAVLDSFQMGSAMSLRNMARLGSTLSLFGASRFGSSLSVLDFASVGSSLSLRSANRFGSSLSLFANSRFGSTLSVVDLVHLGASLSLRSYGRLGSAFSVIGGIQISNDLKLWSASTFYYPSGSGQPSNVKKLSFPESSGSGLTGGIFHGTWVTDVMITTSDRRLKKDIAPLSYELRNLEKQQSRGGYNDISQGSGVDWILRELRPVSFRFRASDDSKALSSRSFGFVAQELEKSLPGLVRTGSDQTKFVMYQDLVALITLAVQEQQTRLNFQDKEVSEAQELVQQLLQSADALDEELDRVEQQR
eukprot:gnl/MRDRNA2_/MRDRNA2_78965_c0_seq2.p1 gnl/MRDRNA2_/MRDRNA2_78965_c0~~gnl/MRDRNA2_/MRDRNA2_78965_c0_seq2.p1  ORF type:complete len:419 (+),score=47.16 gnl/MRDRNA2_/MRDRNA2_78965_c0_seq2:2-1258(+)